MESVVPRENQLKADDVDMRDRWPPPLVPLLSEDQDEELQAALERIFPKVKHQPDVDEETNRLIQGCQEHNSSAKPEEAQLRPMGMYLSEEETKGKEASKKCTCRSPLWT
ncbi:hypothetical protein DPEC_G00335730 [Dallia pectoralis]|uniref:Uncharacterized protein n=1 Tax=Dallia pectoralis TaxID=75939 RepID=A0ACC2F718_DALPE|nr:hypothetical protein DPEC_G00335730 [Dallia pectoralis]